MIRPIVRHALPLSATLALAAGTAPAQSTIARAAGVFTGSASVYGDDGPAKRTDTQDGSIGLSLSRAGSGVAFSGNGRTAAMSMALITDDGARHEATGALSWTVDVRFKHTGLAYFHPVQLFLDGVLTPASDNPYRGGAVVSAGVVVYGPGGTGPGGALLDDYLTTRDDDVTSNDVAHFRTFLVPIVGGVAGTWSTYRFVYTLAGSADYGWDADFSHTMHAYLPMLEGHAWEADDAFADQSRPAWGTGATVPGEVLPATTAPEPAASWLLLSGGLALGVVRRRRTGLDARRATVGLAPWRRTSGR